ncbi:MAG: peptide-methionine (S)-S-oxide reductase MsrA [Sphingomonadales bacterium]
MARQALATLAGGCFWCTEAAFDALAGVTKAVPGYIGGARPNPSYEQVCTGVTGHAEAVQISYDPDIIGYDDLLDVFFVIHDPTQLNRQGHDVGTQYRSAIFPQTPEQAAAAEAAIARAQADWDAPIVTSIEADAPFYPAEAYHHDYFARNPGQPYCQAVVAPKLAKLRQKFTARLKSS